MVLEVTHFTTPPIRWRSPSSVSNPLVLPKRSCAWIQGSSRRSTRSPRATSRTPVQAEAAHIPASGRIAFGALIGAQMRAASRANWWTLWIETWL